MENGQLTWITNFIWGIADDVLRDLECMGGKAGIKDTRFVVQHRGKLLSLITRTSDSQMLFLMRVLSKMKHDTPLGSRIAEVHNGSSLFMGDAGHKKKTYAYDQHLNPQRVLADKAENISFEVSTISQHVPEPIDSRIKYGYNFQPFENVR